MKNSRIVAIGDVHGNFSGLVSNLKRAEVIDDDLNWILKDGNLLQLGDIFDRGQEGLKSLNFLYDIQKKARNMGGEVYLLYGNHEQMLMHGLPWFAVKEEGYSSIDEYVNDFSPVARIGKRILDSHKLGVILNDILFVHAGFMAKWLKEYYPVKTTIAQMNQGINQAFINGNNKNPFFKAGWARGGSETPGPLWADYFDELCTMEDEEVNFVLDYFGVKKMIVGHTPLMEENVAIRYNGKIINIDVGLTPEYGGYEAVLIIDGKKIVAKYPEREEKII